jgi:hypothetical protein
LFTADVAQLVRAPVCGTGGRGFNSHHSPHVATNIDPARNFGKLIAKNLAGLCIVTPFPIANPLAIGAPYFAIINKGD